MRKNEIKADGKYIAKDNQKLTVVRIDAIRGNNYTVTNLATGRKSVFHSAAKFLSLATPEAVPSEKSIEASAASVLKGFDSTLPELRKHIARQIARALTAYLEEAIGYVQDVGTPIIIAMDLENAVAPAPIRARLGEMKCLEGKSLDLDKLSQTLASVRGITLGITLVEKRYGGLKIDFSDDVSMTADFAKPLLLEVLAYRGAMIDEFNDWTVTLIAGQAEDCQPVIGIFLMQSHPVLQCGGKGHQRIPRSAVTFWLYRALRNRPVGVSASCVS